MARIFNRIMPIITKPSVYLIYPETIESSVIIPRMRYNTVSIVNSFMSSIKLSLGSSNGLECAMYRQSKIDIRICKSTLMRVISMKREPILRA